MNFQGMLQPVAFKSTKRGAVDQVPKPLLVRGNANRRLAALKEAGEIVDQLPGPGESLHALMTGRYDLTDLLDVILAKLGTAKHLRIATLSFNGHNVQQLRGWLESGKVKRLTVLCSLFFYEHNPDTFRELREAMQAAGRGNRIGATRNHCKVCCLEFRGSKLALEGSANLRTNSNREQFCLVNAAELHDWHALWIDEAIHGSEINAKPTQ